jgi:hypothetical protein
MNIIMRALVFLAARVGQPHERRLLREREAES